MSHELVGAALPSEGGCSFTLRVGVLPRQMLLQLVILRTMLALHDHFLDLHELRFTQERSPLQVSPRP